MYLFRDAARQRDSRRPLDERDDEGARIISGRRAITRQPVTEELLRSEVQANLADLFNAVAFEETQDLSRVPQVRRSVLNYGITDLASITIDEMRLSNIAERLKQAVVTYEPRLAPGSVVVERDETASVVGLEVRFVVSGDLVMDPLNVPVTFLAEVEREAGRFRVRGNR